MLKNFKVLNKDPSIILYENFLEKNLCKKIIESFSRNLKTSMTSDGKKNILHEGRRSKSCFLNPKDKILSQVLFKLSLILGISEGSFEKPQFTLYEIGDGYVPHSDAFDFRDKQINKKIKARGQRISTNIIYLNDTLKGGETFFPILDLKQVPSIGNLISFNNCMDGTLDLHPFSIHQSLPVIKGKKYILTFWALSHEK